MPPARAGLPALVTLDGAGFDRCVGVRMVHQLSDGRRRRLAIARAPVIEPRVDRLAEPTSALDLSIRTESPNRLTRPRGEPRLTCLLPRHGLAAAADMCEEAAVMREVEVVETLSVELTLVDVP